MTGRHHPTDASRTSIDDQWKPLNMFAMRKVVEHINTSVRPLKTSLNAIVYILDYLQRNLI